MKVMFTVDIPTIKEGFIKEETLLDIDALYKEYADIVRRRKNKTLRGDEERAETKVLFEKQKSLRQRITDELGIDPTLTLRRLEIKESFLEWPAGENFWNDLDN